jgi:hypothetical protein
MCLPPQTDIRDNGISWVEDEATEGCVNDSGVMVVQISLDSGLAIGS